MKNECLRLPSRTVDGSRIYSQSDLFLDIFREKGGAIVDRSDRTIEIPEDMVQRPIEVAPRTVCFVRPMILRKIFKLNWGILILAWEGTSGAPLFWDFELRRSRQPTKQDMINSTRVGHALTHIDFVQALCMSGDMPTGHTFFYDFDTIFRNTTKPTVINILERPFTQSLLEMAAAASGGEDLLRQKPSMLGIVTPVSPFKIAVMNEGIIDAVKAGVPILYSPGPLMGASAPATVAGTVVMTNTEVLFGVVPTQLIKEGSPIVLQPDTDVFDMKTSQVTYGSPEQDLGKVAMVQLARRYGLPIHGLGGGVDSKLPDAQAAAEAMETLMMVSLAGMTMCQSLGTLAFGMFGSQEMTVICDEMVYAIKRILDGFTVDDDTLGLDVIRSVGFDGNYLEQPHTIRHFRKGVFHLCSAGKQMMNGLKQEVSPLIRSLMKKFLISLKMRNRLSFSRGQMLNWDVP